MLAKTESAEHITRHSTAWGARHGPCAHRIGPGHRMGTHDRVCRGVIRLAFGSGDYRRDTGASADELAMAYPRSRLVVASRIGDLPARLMDLPSARVTAFYVINPQ